LLPGVIVENQIVATLWLISQKKSDFAGCARGNLAELMEERATHGRNIPG